MRVILKKDGRYNRIKKDESMDFIIGIDIEVHAGQLLL